MTRSMTSSPKYTRLYTIWQPLGKTFASYGDAIFNLSNVVSWCDVIFLESLPLPELESNARNKKIAKNLKVNMKIGANSDSKKERKVGLRYDLAGKIDVHPHDDTSPQGELLENLQYG